MSQKLFDRTTIKFPNPLEPDAVEEIFSHLSEEFEYNINYTIKIMGQLSKGRENSRYVKSIKGTMSDSKLASLSEFECFGEPFSAIYGMFSGIKFSGIVGYELEEHPESMVAMWNTVRTQVNKYFKEKETK